MRRIVWLTGWLVLGAVPVPAFEDRTGEVPKCLQGTWVVTSAQRNGEETSDVVGHRLSFTGRRFVIRSQDGEVLYEGTVRMDTGKTPAAVDFRHTAGMAKGTVWKGIYSLKGNTLRIC